VALLTTRPLGVKHVRVRLRVGVIVVLHVRGRAVRHLDPRALAVRRQGALRLLELRLVNHGNVDEELGKDGLRMSLLRDGRRLVTLRPRSGELLPHGSGIAVFPYRGRLRGPVLARVELPPPIRGARRSFHIRL
jgi:hypothetical protein